MRKTLLITTVIVAAGLSPAGAEDVLTPQSAAQVMVAAQKTAATLTPQSQPAKSLPSAKRTPLQPRPSQLETAPPPTVTASLSVADQPPQVDVVAVLANKLPPHGPSDPAAAWNASYLGVEPILSRACGDCHRAEDSEGGFDLTRLYQHDAVQLGRTESQTLIRVLQQHEMPPEGSSDLTDTDRDFVVDWLRRRPVGESDCDQIASDESAPWYRGYVMSRRLTRAEYNNCIRDLTGLDYLRFQNDFPADGAGGEGFDTHGATLFTSPILMEKLLAAANNTIDEAVPDTRIGVSSERLHARAKILGPLPEDESDLNLGHARRVLHSFAEKAWRQPAEAADVDRLLAVYLSRREAGLAYVPALKMPLKAILLSPNFLFVAETTPDDLPGTANARAAGVRRISGPEMAQRLAMFLWSTMPDERLRELSETDAIFEPETLRREVRRMLADPRSRGLAENFGLQWLGLTELTSMLAPDAGHFPDFDSSLAEAMREEAVRLMLWVLQDNRPVTDLIDTRVTVVNVRLARHYGMAAPSADPDEFVKVVAPVDRGGVVTLGGVLATTSYPHRTSPVLRGQWILDTVLGTPVSGPPANVPELDESIASDAISFRERLAEHRRNPDCAACHAKMDPLGFSLEAFDAVGRRRDLFTANGPIDTSGELPDGTRFDGASELKDVLLSRRESFVRHLARKLMGYAMGRELNEFDDCTIDRAVQALDQNNNRIGVIVEEIALSYAFQHRYFKK